ncbi:MULTISPECIES: hypothetical protein [unclassified Streptomyces]|uniref:hypothetical protein n=1 Tax=unclassified Streptomyces TaxID=2593676 RepID=UPI0035DEB457
MKDDRTVQFGLWHPRYESNDTRITCVVDVSPFTDVLLQDGDRELVSHFAEQLGLGSASLTEWSVHGFNTPFYSFDIDAEDFADWMTPAWRLRLVVDDWHGSPPQEPTSPVPAWGYDQTWWAHRARWDWNAHETVVIALNGPDPDLDFLNNLDQTLDVETLIYSRPKFTVGQLRISLGRINLPENGDAVFEVVMACHQQAMTVHSSASMSIMEQD